MSFKSKTRLFMAMGALGALGLAGCSGAGDEAPADGGQANEAGTQEAVPEIAELLPQEIKDAGVLRVGTAAAYPPMTFLDDEGGFTGLDPDLARAVGGVLGVEVKLENLPFDGILAGVLADRFDAAWSVMSVTQERMEQVDFVSYLEAGTQILVQAGNPAGLSDEKSLCGQDLAVVKGSSQDLKIVPELSATCEDEGLEPINKFVFPAQGESNQALVSGRVVGSLDDGSILAWQAKQAPDTFELHSLVVDPSPVGVALTKGDAELAEAIRAATQYLIDNGEYQELLETWSLGDGAIDTAEINPGV